MKAAGKGVGLEKIMLSGVTQTLNIVVHVTPTPNLQT